MSPDTQIRAAFRALSTAYYKRRALVAAVENIARVGGVGFAAVAGADMPARLEVADSVAARLFAGARALEQGSAVLVQWRGDYAILPRAVIERYRDAARVLDGPDDDDDDGLGAWPVWLVAGAIVAGVIALALVAYTILEVTNATAQNERAARDLHARAASWLAERCIADPARCGQFADAFNRGLSTFAPNAGGYGDQAPSPWDGPARAAGGLGLAIAGIAAIVIFGGKKSGRRR